MALWTQTAAGTMSGHHFGYKVLSPEDNPGFSSNVTVVLRREC